MMCPKNKHFLSFVNIVQHCTRGQFVVYIIMHDHIQIYYVICISIHCKINYFNLNNVILLKKNFKHVQYLICEILGSYSVKFQLYRRFKWFNTNK